jgi:aminoglycoside 3-N-acetyltransferase
MPVTRSSILQSLSQLGISTGDTVMVHSSLRAIGPIIGGAATLINALLETIGPTGTLAAYVDFEPFYEDDDPEIPVFNSLTAPAARDHGILHELIRSWPGSLRSGHPDAGVAAIGFKAAWIVDDHAFQYGYGPGTPFAKLLQLNARILMLGAPLDTITMLHHAEHLAKIPDKSIVRYRRFMPTPAGPQWIDFEEFDTGDPVHPSLPTDVFEQIAEAFLASGQGHQAPLGNATATRLDSQDIIPFAITWLERWALALPA